MFAMYIMSAILLGRLPWWPIGIALFLAGSRSAFTWKILYCGTVLARL